MKRTLAALSAFAIVGGLLVASGPSEPAQASGAFGNLTVNCATTSTLRASLAALATSNPRVSQFPPGTPTASTVWVISGFNIGNTFNVVNSAPQNPGGSCVIDDRNMTTLDGTGIVNGDGDILVPADNTSSPNIPVKNSGSFQLYSNQDGFSNRVRIHVDACSLTGSGIALDPWRVGSLANLGIVGLESSTPGASSCLLSGHYLQTASISDVDTYNGSLSRNGADVIAGTFTGTYDGDHYGISYTSPGGSMARWEDRPPLFEILGVGGVIKRLSLTGLIKVDRGHTRREISGLVGRLDGGLISEVGSSVNIDAKGPNAIIGGLVARAGATANTTQRIQYSSFGGRLDWIEDPNPNPDITLPDGPPIALVGGPTIGGLVGMAEGATSRTEIRDSYSRAQISFDSSRLDGSNASTAVYAGGLIGSDGLNEFNTGTGVRTHAASLVRILRSYAAGSFRNTCPSTTASVCNTDNPTHVFEGALIGVSENLVAGDELVSAFALSGRPTVGDIVGNATDPSEYTVGGFPQAARLSATLLRTLSTYQSEEKIVNSVGTDEPSGTSDLLTAASTGTLVEQDYRWAIEAGNVETFVPSGYGTESNYLTRTLFADTLVTKSYRREGAGVLSVHGGSDLRDVTGYPTLGRVWEICSGDYPTLVWEERDCAVGGGGDSTGSARASQAQAAGLSGAELAEFIASGLTLEQWLARRLAATGTPSQMITQGLLAAAFLAIAGVGLVLGRRRWGLG